MHIQILFDGQCIFSVKYFTTVILRKENFIIEGVMFDLWLPTRTIFSSELILFKIFQYLRSNYLGLFYLNVVLILFFKNLMIFIVKIQNH